jgi:DNA-binding SARP family transcriptional activator
MTAPQQLAYEQLTSLDPQVRLVIIHPNFLQQHLLLPQLIERNGLYLRFDGARLDAEALDQQLTDAHSAQLADAPLEALDYVVIDEGDRIGDALLLPFINNLLNRIKFGRIILCTRVAPLELLTDDTLRSCTAFLPSSEGLMLWDYARRPQTEGRLLEVRSLGAGRVQLDGQPIKEWDGLLPRSLFFYLIDRGMATRNEIFDTFWPNLNVREATNVFHVTKRKISEVLGVDLTVYWSGFYHISPRIHLSYDVSMFTQLINEAAVASPEESVDALRQAVALYRGDFLSTIDMPWVMRRRQDLLQMCGEALIALARTTESMGSPQQALGLYLRASTSNLQREDVAVNIMRLYREQHQYGDALRVYRRLENELRSSLNVAPAPPLQEMARQIEDEMRRSNGGGH